MLEWQHNQILATVWRTWEKERDIHLDMIYFGVDFCHHFGPLEIVFIMFQQKLACFFIQGWLRIWDNQQALYSLNNKIE